MGSLLPPLDNNTTLNNSTNLLTSLNSSSHEIQLADAKPTLDDHHQSTCHTSVNISADDSATSPPSVQNRLSSLRTLASLLGMFFILLSSLILLPLLVVFCLIMRLLQFIRYGRAYYDTTQLKLFMRIWICLLLLVLASTCVICSWAPLYFDDTKLDRAITRLILTLPISMYYLILGLSFFTYILPPILCVIIPYHSPFDYVGLYIRDRVLEIIDCLLFWWVESKVVEYIPAIRHHKILGVHTQNGIQVSLFLFIGYNVITLLTCVIVLGLQKLVSKKFYPGINDTAIEHSVGGKYIVYCANGMKISINFILIALMLLLTWVLYFGSHLNDTPKAQNVLKIGTWTCVSILICSVSWLIKTSVLLSWKAIAVYNRLSSKILAAGNQLYFLGLIGRHTYDVFNLQYDASKKQLEKDDKQKKSKKDKLSCTNGLKDDEEDKGKMRLCVFNLKLMLCRRKPLPFKKAVSKMSWFSFLAPFYSMLSIVDNHKKSKSDDVDEWAKHGVSRLSDEDEQVKHSKVKKLSREVKKRVRNDLLMQDGLTPTIHGIQKVAQYLLAARKVLSNDKYTSHILLYLEKGSEDGISIEEDLMKQLIEGEKSENNDKDDIQQSSSGLDKGKVKHEWDYFKDQLGTCCGDIELVTIKAWMDRARNNCLFLANILSSAKEVVGCLNNIISSLLIAATLIMWLLVSGLATTKAFVLIASPLLAATFIFGDTCKSLFQGIMFVYVVHPFDIGDLCVIDEKMMEVRTIGVWKTTFLRVGTQAEVIFTNTELSNKNIVNHKTDFDWNDTIELEVTSLDTEQIRELKQKIETHLDVENKKFNPSYNCVMVLTTGSNIKIAISFQHQVNHTCSTYFECVKEKQRRQSELALDIHDLLKKTKK